MTDLGTLGGSTSGANAINASGQITGVAYTNGTSNYDHAFLYSNGKMTDLGTLGGQNVSVGTGINDSGQVVGYAYASNGLTAFVDSNGTMTDLNSLISPSCGMTLLEATGINDAGQIIGWGTTNVNDVTQGFLLTPVPEPSTLVLLGIGAVSLLAYAWRRRRS